MPADIPDTALSEVLRLTEPLLPHDRAALLHALGVLLRSEPQPPSSAAVNRHCRALLRTGAYRRADWLITAGGWHDQRKPVERPCECPVPGQATGRKVDRRGLGEA